MKADRDRPRLKNGYRCRNKSCINPELILRKGLRRIPHFAHKRCSNCDVYSEPETDAHLAMKFLLQERLRIPDENVEYCEIEGVRPDLLMMMMMDDDGGTVPTNA